MIVEVDCEECADIDADLEICSLNTQLEQVLIFSHALQILLGRAATFYNLPTDIRTPTSGDAALRCFKQLAQLVEFLLRAIKAREQALVLGAQRV